MAPLLLWCVVRFSLVLECGPSQRAKKGGRMGGARYDRLRFRLLFTLFPSEPYPCRVSIQLYLVLQPPRFAEGVPAPPSRALRSTIVAGVAPFLDDSPTLVAEIDIILSASPIHVKTTNTPHHPRGLSFSVETPRATSSAS